MNEGMKEWKEGRNTGMIEGRNERKEGIHECLKELMNVLMNVDISNDRLKLRFAI